LTEASRRRLQLLAIALAAIAAYAPSSQISLIADDFPNISQAITWGAPEGVRALLGDAQFRLRSTSYWVMFGLWQAGELTPWVYHSASLLLHILNAWLVFVVAQAKPDWRRAAFWAALFFAVHEGHQEAVMWFSAVNELLLFGFGMASLVCWLRGREAASAGLFAMALLSKESAVVLLPLFLVADPGRWRRLAPHVVLGMLALASVMESRGNSFRFHDGSFSLAAPFWLTWPRSMMRLMWFWGWLAAGWVWMKRGDRREMARWLLWMGVALAPYSFLTYSTQIPSRQTYLASAGLAMVVGLGASLMKDRRFAAVVMAAMLIHNVGYLWTKKRTQFLERAAPTEELIRYGAGTRGPIQVRCFPYPPIVAEEALRLATGRAVVWSKDEGFCYAGK
jgi:hypothetical protein